MERIAIIGVSGAGKTTLAKQLSSIFNHRNVYHLDRLFWQRDWKAKNRDTRIDILQCLVLEPGWIIDGTYLSVSNPHLSMADTIIFLDMPPLLCLRRLFKRHFEFRNRPRRDIPEGCTDRLTLQRIVKVPTFPVTGRGIIIQQLDRCRSQHIIWLHTPEEVEKFVKEVEQKEIAKRIAYEQARPYLPV